MRRPDAGDVRRPVYSFVDRVTLDEDQPTRRTRLNWWIHDNWKWLYFIVFLPAGLWLGIYFTSIYGERIGGYVFWFTAGTFPGAVAAIAIRWRGWKPPGMLVDVEHPDGKMLDWIELNRDMVADVEFVGGKPQKKWTSQGNPVYKARRWIPEDRTDVKIDLYPDDKVDGEVRVDGPALVCPPDAMPDIGEMETMHPQRREEEWREVENAVRYNRRFLEVVDNVVNEKMYAGIYRVTKAMSELRGPDSGHLDKLSDLEAEDLGDKLESRLPWTDVEADEAEAGPVDAEQQLDDLRTAATQNGETTESQA